MFACHRHPLPERALLAEYTRRGAYTDCYLTELPGTARFADYVAAFYTTAVFKTERLILRWAVQRPSTDEQAHALAAGARDAFAAWDVEQRAANQLLMCDLFGRTRSWLMLEAAGGSTRLYFGSAVLPRAAGKGMGFLFTALLPFHQLYSQVLLASARRRLSGQRAA